MFQKYSDIQQTLPVKAIDDLCSLLNETFPSSQMELNSPLCDIIAPMKRVLDPSISSKGKLSNFMNLMTVRLLRQRLLTVEWTLIQFQNQNVYLMAYFSIHTIYLILLEWICQ